MNSVARFSSLPTAVFPLTVDPDCRCFDTRGQPLLTLPTHPMTDAEKGPAPDAADLSADPPDLLQLLQRLKFEHWHGQLMDLSQRFDGWMADYLEQPESSPDFRPMADMLAVLSALPIDMAGDDMAFALALTECDFFARAARNECEGGLMWDPCVESYRAFSQRHPERFPYWDAGPAWPPAALAQWLVGRLPARQV